MNAIDCSPALLRETVRLALPNGMTYDEALGRVYGWYEQSNTKTNEALKIICINLCGGNEHAGSILANDVIYGGSYD